MRIFGIKGAYWALFCLFSKKEKLVQVGSKWSIYPLFIRLNTSDMPVFRQVFIDRQYDIIENIDTNVCEIIDAGANIGLTSIFFIKKYPFARIYAIEPEIKNFQLMVKNTQKYNNIFCIKGALWDKDTPINLVSCDAENWGFRTTEAIENPIDKFIDGYQITTLIKKYEIKHISILKLDVEGAEYEIFGNYKNWIDYVDNIIIELHENIRLGCSDRFYEATRNFEKRATTRELVLVCRVTN